MWNSIQLFGLSRNLQIWLASAGGTNDEWESYSTVWPLDVTANQQTPDWAARWNVSVIYPLQMKTDVYFFFLYVLHMNYRKSAIKCQLFLQTMKFSGTLLEIRQIKSFKIDDYVMSDGFSCLALRLIWDSYLLPCTSSAHGPGWSRQTSGTPWRRPRSAGCSWRPQTCGKPHAGRRAHLARPGSWTESNGQ